MVKAEFTDPPQPYLRIPQPPGDCSNASAWRCGYLNFVTNTIPNWTPITYDWRNGWVAAYQDTVTQAAKGLLGEIPFKPGTATQPSWMAFCKTMDKYRARVGEEIGIPHL